MLSGVRGLGRCSVTVAAGFLVLLITSTRVLARTDDWEYDADGYAFGPALCPVSLPYPGISWGGGTVMVEQSPAGGMTIPFSIIGAGIVTWPGPVLFGFAWYAPFPSSTSYNGDEWIWEDAAIYNRCTETRWFFGLIIVRQVTYLGEYLGYAVMVGGQGGGGGGGGGGGEGEEEQRPGGGGGDCYEVWLVWRDENGTIVDEEYLGTVCEDET